MHISEISTGGSSHQQAVATSALAVPRWLAVAVLAASLAACGGKNSTPSTQVAAKVGKGEISVHQINFVLQRQGANVPPAQREAAQKQVLDRLIDQEVALQKAQELKIDREPQVMQEIEAARREIIARAYVNNLITKISKPLPEEVKKYYSDNPLLYAQRKIYDFQEVNVLRASTEQATAVSAKIGAARSADEAVALLKSVGLTPETRQSSLAPENMPVPVVQRLAALPPGQPLLLNAGGGGFKVVFLTASRPAPVDEATALPRIEAQLLSDRRRLRVEEDLKSLRAAAKVEYTGPFASSASAPGAAPAAAPAPEAKPASSSTGIDDATISRGLK